MAVTDGVTLGDRSQSPCFHRFPRAPPCAVVRGRGPSGRAEAFRRGVDPALIERFSPTGTILRMHIDTITTITSPDLDWQQEALCAQTGADFFFPEPGSSVREAKRICGLCPIRSTCLEYALDNDERFGVWGGLSEKERLELRRTSR
ncbi:Transcription factor WhiB [Streptomyces sp. cf386]|nr:Transcription factor WhiB [Streptomyces sp. cf386]